MISAPNTMSGRSRAHVADERQRIGAQMPALHALEDHIVAGLQRQMQMRHQPAVRRWRRYSASSASIEVDRGDAQPRQIGHVPEDRLHQLAEARRARQVGAIAGDVDAGQHHFAIAVADQPLHLLDHRAHRHRARRPAAIGDDAEGAAMVAAVLHLDERPGVPVHALDQMAARSPCTDMMSLTCTLSLSGTPNAIGAIALGASACRHCR